MNKKELVGEYLKSVENGSGKLKVKQDG